MKTAIISRRHSDFGDLLLQVCDADYLLPEEAMRMDLLQYDSIAVLGGTEEKPFTMPIDLRLKMEEYHASEKPIFYEWCSSFGNTYTAGPVNDVADRLIYIGEKTEGLLPGDLLDDHDNAFIAPYSVPPASYPLVYNGGHVMKHEHTDEFETAPRRNSWILWMYDGHTAISSIRLCDFLRARFAPTRRWQALVTRIFAVLGLPAPDYPEPYAHLSDAGRDASPESVFRKGMAWFDGAGLYLDNGKSGVKEGLHHNIRPDGTQKRADAVRNDCSGEVGGACFFDWLLHKTPQSELRFRNLASFCFDKMQVKEGMYHGMMRWSTEAWGVCYQDDVARTILGTMLSMKITGDRTRLHDVEEALDFLVKTTGTDGLRVSRTDLPTLTEEKIAALSSQPSRFFCAHHNAYYHAVLLLAYQLDGRKSYLDTAIKGLTSLMNAYPDTIREHSETQELCRLVLPLAILYETTGEKEHLAWLEKVCARLDEFRHPTGAYVEYDTGYKAARSRTSGTESSLLADNGDEVADLLYSSNWLPLGFAYAYFATRDEAYHARWQGIVRFLAAAQTVSEDPALRGSWARGIDLKNMEIYGVPHDIGWGPCCVESGWTVAEILMGIGFGLAVERNLLERNLPGCAENS